MFIVNQFPGKIISCNNVKEHFLESILVNILYAVESRSLSFYNYKLSWAKHRPRLLRRRPCAVTDRFPEPLTSHARRGLCARTRPRRPVFAEVDIDSTLAINVDSHASSTPLLELGRIPPTHTKSVLLNNCWCTLGT